jgi:hypothetical protein
VSDIKVQWIALSPDTADAWLRIIENVGYRSGRARTLLRACMRIPNHFLLTRLRYEAKEAKNLDLIRRPHCSWDIDPCQLKPETPNCVISPRTNSQKRKRGRSIDAQRRALIHYALAINHPWLAGLVRCIDAGQPVGGMDFSQEPPATNDDVSDVDRIEALAEMICRGGDEPDTKSAASCF